MATATATATKTSRPRGKPVSLWLKILWGVLTVGAVGLFSVVIVWFFGSVYGTEICAETLERRSYFFLEIPIIRLQVRGIEYKQIPNDVSTHLTTNNIVTVPPANKKTWHSITAGRGVLGMRTGDPEIVVRYLEARDANSEYAWLAWTKDNPKIAPHIWKGVTDLAVAGEYTTIPDVIELAQGATDPVKTQAAVDKVVKAVVKTPVATKGTATPAAKPAEKKEDKKDEKKSEKSGEKKDGEASEKPAADKKEKTSEESADEK
ncbi:hypothetical protein NA78x_004550 [Anatilimnocola sp. NA78]|uniref:hypothetical protein n=1 Tax=Anatilimnocola sp. NA78 TaxID=3415683 RepID=UPI003CE5202D